MSDAPAVVFDCNVFLQALASPDGPAGRCVAFAFEGKAKLFISTHVLNEIREVASSAIVIRKLRIRPDRLDALIENLPKAAVLIPVVAEVWTYDRDPDDAHYVNLALAARASLVVSRDRDLLDLMDISKPHAAEFQRRFPSLKILDPLQFLGEMGERRQASS